MKFLIKKQEIFFRMLVIPLFSMLLGFSVPAHAADYPGQMIQTAGTVSDDYVNLYPVVDAYTAEEEAELNAFYLGQAFMRLGYFLDEQTLLGDVAADTFFTIGYPLCAEHNPEMVGYWDTLYGNGNISEQQYMSAITRELVSANVLYGEMNDGIMQITGISEEFVDEFQKYAAESLDPGYGFIYTMPLDEVPASYFRYNDQRLMMYDWFELEQTAADAALTTSENRVGFIESHTAGAFNVYDITGMHIVLGTNRTIDAAAYSASVNALVPQQTFRGADYYISNGNSRFVLYDSSGALPSVEYWTVNPRVTPWAWVDNGAVKQGGFELNFYNYLNTYNATVYVLGYPVSAPGTSYPIGIFDDTTILNTYLAGQADVYYIPSTYTGGDIIIDPNFDYDEFYKQLKDAIQGADVVSPNDLQQIIDDFALDYMQDIVDGIGDNNGLLEDIKGILKDIRSELEAFHEDFDSLSFWMKTDMIVDRLTEVAWEELEADFVEAKAVASDVLGIASNKIPFSFARDLEYILSVLSVEPVKPEIEIPINFYEYSCTFTINFDLVEPAIEYFRFFVLFGYIVGLVFLTIRANEAMKGV